MATADEFILIIDDMGYHKHDLQFFELPSGITFSILPYTPYAKHIVQRAADSGRELMLHLPMEAHNGKKMGPGGLDSAMDESAFRAEMNHVLDSYPQVKGVNNHMGSKLSELDAQMTWFVDELQKRPLYFIDSKTSPRSVAEARAKPHVALVGHRDVFLDHFKTEAFIAKQLKQVEQRMAQGEIPVVLAHPYPVTLQALNRLLPALLAKGVQIVPASQGLVKKKQIAASATALPQGHEYVSRTAQ